MPTRSPLVMCTLMASAACTMPKALVKSMVCKIGLSSGTLHSFGTAAEARDHALIHGPQPSRLEENNEQHNNAQGHLPGIGRILVGIRSNELEGNSPDQRPWHTAVPPEQGDEDELAGLGPEGVFRDDMPNRKGRQDATESPEGAGEHVGRVDDALHRFSRVFNANFVVRQGLEIISEGG